MLDNDDELIVRMIPMIMIRIVLFRTITKKDSSRTRRITRIGDGERLWGKRIFCVPLRSCTTYYVTGARNNKAVVGGTDHNPTATQNGTRIPVMLTRIGAG